MTLLNDDDDGSYVSSVADPDESHTDFEGDQQEDEKVVIAQAENKAVWWIRMLVILVLVASATGVALTVYFYTNNAEIDDFEEEFSDAATKVFESVGATLDHILGAVDAFNANMVAYAQYSNSTWPFVTLPNYAVHAAKLLSLSKAFTVNTYALVQEDQRQAWENYTVSDGNDAWVDEGLEVQSRDKNFKGTQIEEYYTSSYIYDNMGDPVVSPGPYYPTWQSAPVVPYFPPYNWDAGVVPEMKSSMEAVLRSKSIVIDGAINLVVNPDDPDEVANADTYNAWASGFLSPDEDPSEPYGSISYPIIDSAIDGVSTVEGNPDTGIGSIVSFTSLSLFFRDLISDVLPPRSGGINVVFDNTCGSLFTYEINGPETRYIGGGDLHDTSYDYLGQTSKFSNLGVFQLRDRTYSGLPLSEDYCPYSLKVYPSKATEDVYRTNNPVIYTVVTVVIFAFTSLVFLLYDFLVERRQKKVMTTAVQSSAIVSSIYPSIVRDRLFGQDNKASSSPKADKTETFMVKSDPMKENGLKSFLSGEGNTTKQTESTDQGSPIAEHFPATTVMFADLAGFTGWSSQRDPKHVFRLLESVYGAFDRAAKRRRVFKVETIGDCYVAVTGLPEPRKDHATVMAKFAKDCRDILNRKVRELQVELGPDTADLKLRTGLHSGPVIAGVLRGEKARFQLFGDTVNTAARMESNGMKDKIHISQTTADALVAAGKEHWITKRETQVEAKGKGFMTTYWLAPKMGTKSQDTYTTESSTGGDDSGNNELSHHVVDWFTGVLGNQLQRIVHGRSQGVVGSADSSSETDASPLPNGGTTLNQVKDVIPFPGLDAAAMLMLQEDNWSLAELDPVVAKQLHEYVASIGSLYGDLPYHNFEHASHVAASATNSLSMIKATVLSGSRQTEGGGVVWLDPLAQFACVFSALIHNVYHPGVSNAQLAAEDPELARRYNGKSIAEQKSIEISWDLLMSDAYKELRHAICGNDDLVRFRQLVVNCVLVTDVVDKDLKAMQNERWETAFGVESSLDDTSRKATLVMEHLIQASVYAHTMQHWDIYRKWSERFFHECYQSFQEGRTTEDPSEKWFLGEMGFFDNFVIPLAKKLQDSGVFGDKFLASALRNRKGWEEQGRDIVEAMLENVLHPEL